MSLEASFDERTDLLEIKSAGTGFMMTKRVVYERMIEAYPETKISESHPHEKECPMTLSWLHNFFPIEMVDGQLWVRTSRSAVAGGCSAARSGPIRLSSSHTTASMPTPAIR